MSEAKVETVRALAEAFFPGLHQDAESARNANQEAVATFLETSAANMDFVIAAVMENMKKLTPENQKELDLLFFLLKSGPGTATVAPPWMLLSMCPPMQPFAKLPVHQREAILQWWSVNPIPLMKKAFKGLRSLILSTAFNATMAKGGNPLWPGIGYEGPNPERAQKPTQARLQAEAVLQQGMLHVGNAPCKNPEDLLDFIRSGLGKAFCAQSIQLEGDAVVMTADAVICGSGAGGGVAAALLAEAGAKVIVLEKGGFTPAAELALTEQEGFSSMYEMASLLTTQDAGMSILAGSTLGGGTRVNWQASFKTPDHVRREWAEEHGLSAITSERYTAALDAVCTRLGVTTGIQEHSKPNQKLKAGLEKLGVHCGEIPRNCSTAHTCGHCCFGCPSGDKQDGTGTYLSDAAGHGACIFTGVYADKILMEKCAGVGQRKRQAVGVAALTTAAPGGRHFRLVVKAKYVISSAGTLHTPALLLRSKITCRGNVGKNLRLHPATAILGLYNKETHGEKNGEPKVLRHTVLPPLPMCEKSSQGQTEIPEEIHTWKGSIFSIFSNKVANWEGSGYGALLQTPSAHPGLMAASMPWLDGQDFKRLCTWMPYVAVTLVLTRDRGSGRVTIGRDGLPRLHYWPDEHDQESMMQGMELGLQTLAAGGAMMVGTLQGGKREVSRFEAERDKAGNMTDQPAFDNYLRGVRKTGIKKNSMTVFSAHQMGTARMGADPKKSCVDPQGECWEVSNLYVADASLFPTSTGVNPMITVEAMAYMVAQGLAQNFKNGAVPQSQKAVLMPEE
ncbi:hypothetical protein CVIRNUC_008733 [Coccomyxa viridis]|uniref:Long-chain-alcohol oxidase n=1 Tax=Coccomyxa viridis TaxID=1274662 RepID=A0AAV1IDY6_9CHLO|nr:hypothetical protein CVIRNUC_008733 [Coccomyxa viridis]